MLKPLQIVSDPESALLPFPAENNGLRPGGADSHLSCFTLDCKPHQCTMNDSPSLSVSFISASFFGINASRTNVFLLLFLHRVQTQRY